MRRGFLQVSFAWLFGIIAGVVILVLAIYLATKLINTGSYQTSSETQAQISVLLNPLETGFQSGQVTTLSLSLPTRIYNTCDNQSGTFGKQIISISQQSFGKWSTPSQGIAMQSKYIFSDNPTEGKSFFLFSKPLDLPFKVADLIYMTPSSTNYCFANSPQSVYNELSDLNQQNIILENDPASCPSNAVTVCFSDNGMDCSSANVTVNYLAGTVEKGSAQTEFSGDALMYAAIFSDKQNYDCQLKRVMERSAQLSELYLEKSSTIQKEGCSSVLNSDLSTLKDYASGFSSPEQDLGNIIDISSKLQNENELAQCPLW